MKRHGLALLIALLWSESSVSQARGQEVDVLATILADWKTRQDRTISVEYELKGTGTAIKGSVHGILQNPELIGEGPLPPNDHDYPITLIYKIDFANGLVRREAGGEVYNISTKAFAPEYAVNVFDGKTHTGYQPTEKNLPSKAVVPEVSLEAPTDFAFEFRDLPVFFAHGIVPTARMPVLNALRPPVDSAALRVVGKAVLRDRDCIILKAGKDARVIQFWVDMGKQSAVVRAETYNDGDLGSRLDIDYKKSPWGYVPANWAVNYFFSTHLMGAARFSVERCAVNEPLDPSSFEIPVRPGMVVRKGKMDYFRVNESGQLTPYRSQDGSGPTLRFALIAAAIIVLTAAVIAYKRLATRNV